MKRIINFYRSKKVDILNVMTFIFTILASALIIFLLFALENDIVTKSLTYIIPLTSTFILLLALRVSLISNKIQNSLAFYEAESKKINELSINNNPSIQHIGSLRSFDSAFNIDYSHEIKYTNLSGYLVEVSKALLADEHRIADINSNPNNWKIELQYIEGFVDFFDIYLTVHHQVSSRLDNINKLYKANYLIDAHRVLLINRLYDLIKDFVVFSKTSSDLHNPIIAHKFNKRKKNMDLFDAKRVRLLRQSLSEIVIVSETLK